MTSTNTFQGMDTSSKPSSRVLKPPGGGSSNLFGGGDEVPASPVNKSHKMASNIFGTTEEPQSSPKRTNPPGGKSSGIFGENETPAPRPTAPPTGDNIFAAPPSTAPTFRSHPNKPKDNIGVNALPEPEVPKVRDSTPVQSVSIKGDPAPSPQQQVDPSSPQQTVDSHEPRLGPRPRSHNKVIQPPGGKSSVVFY